MHDEQDVCETATVANTQENAPSEPMGISLGGKAYHLVYIKHVENGFIVTIGCKEFVAITWTDVSHKLQKYWDDPKKAEKEFCK